MSIYWYVWFCEEPLTSMEPFHWLHKRLL